MPLTKRCKLDLTTEETTTVHALFDTLAKVILTIQY